MNVSIIGTGYVGLPAGAGLASKGHDITCVDIDADKVEQINNGDCPIFEEGLPELLEDVVNAGKLRATTDTVEAVKNSDVTFLAVGTPMQDDGSIDLSYIKQAARDAAEGLKAKDGYHVFVVKSTVVPKTTEETVAPIIAEASGKERGEDFGICMNPEFLREGTALHDFLEPDRIVIGEYDDRSGATVARLYEDFDAPVMRTSLRAAELIKYASNSLLATKISFINEIGNLCKELGIDVYEVADGVGLDHRVNRDFLDSGAGFGGSCFPKDVRALISFGEENDVDMALLQQTVDINTAQKTRLVDLLENRIGDVAGRRVAVLGLAFKPGTDDIRKSPAIDIIGELKTKGADVHAYDPKAEANMRHLHPDITYHDGFADAMQGADAALLVTDWPEFNDITLEHLRSMNNAVLLEGRRMDSDLPGEHREGITWP
jgi:UDPglucose 6-dehydrogenase